MIAAIASTLDQDTSFDVVIVGMGNLGRALANSNSFFTRGARLLACYDTSPDVIGTTINGVTIQPFAEDLVSATTGILTTPPEVAQSAAERLVSQGYTAILNFAPVVLRDLPPNVKVQYVDFSVELQVLMYQQRHQLNLGVLHPIGVTSRGHV
jgi:redox-sensing transcriptional repressor